MSGNLEWNKIFGAGLATVFTILVVQQASGFVYKTETPEKMGYAVDIPEEGAAGGAEAVLPPDWGTLIPVADLAAGEAAFARCQACHTINAGGANGIGPNLYGVIGRTVAGHAGFAFSDAMVAHRAVDPTWSLDAMDQFITAPARYVSGTKMSFAGLRDTETRVNLIAWMMTQGSSGYAVPAPDPARQPGAADAAVEGGADTTGAPVEGAAGQSEVQATPAAPPAADSAPVGG